MKAYRTLVLVVTCAFPMFLGMSGEVEAATYIVNTCISGTDCATLTYSLSLNKSNYAPNENIQASATYVDSVCANGGQVGSSVTARNNLDGATQTLFVGTRVATSIQGLSIYMTNAGASGLATFNAGSGAVTSSDVTYRGSVVLGTGHDYMWFDIATLPYTVSAGRCVGTLPTNALPWNSDGKNDTLNVQGDVSKAYSLSDTPTKCEFYCPVGSSWTGTMCKIDGLCGPAGSKDSCTRGTFSDTTDTFNGSGYLDVYNWQCVGSGGGTTASCSYDAPSCNGVVPPNAVLWNDDGMSDTSGLASDVSKGFSNTNSPAKCEYHCDTASGWVWNGSACVLAAANCVGTLPANTEPWNTDGASDTQGLAGDTAKTYSLSDTPAKCQYKCKAGYGRVGGVCVPTIDGLCGAGNNQCTTGTLNDTADTLNGSGYVDRQNWECLASGGGTPATCQIDVVSCDGSIPANATMYANNLPSAPPDGSKSFSPNDTPAACEFRCNDGYSWNGSACTAPAVNGLCGTLSNTCAKGTLNDTADTLNGAGNIDVQRWQCVGTGTGHTDASCTSDVPSCDGTIPTNGVAHNGDGTFDTTGLSGDTSKSHSSTDTAAKCQFYCKAGYDWNGSGCGNTTVTTAACGGAVDACSPGALVSLADSATDYLWQCLGSDNSATTDDRSCSLPKTNSGVCGGASGMSFTSPPSQPNLCNSGSVYWTDFDGSDGAYNWQCIISPGNEPACQATKVAVLPPEDTVGADPGPDVTIYLPQTTAYPNNPRGWGGKNWMRYTWWVPQVCTSSGAPFDVWGFPTCYTYGPQHDATISDPAALVPEFGNLIHLKSYKFNFETRAPYGVGIQTSTGNNSNIPFFMEVNVYHRDLWGANLSVSSAAPHNQGTPMTLRGRTVLETEGNANGFTITNEFKYRWENSGPWLTFAGNSVVQGDGKNPGPGTDYATSSWQLASFIPDRGGNLYIQYCADSLNAVAEAGDNLTSLEGNNCVTAGPYTVNATTPPGVSISACDLGGTNCVNAGVKSVNPSQSVEIQWSSTNANTCSWVSGTGFQVGSATSGTDPVTTPAANTTDIFSVSCTGASGTSVGSVGVTTRAPAPPTLSSNPRIVDVGDKIDLTWSADPDIYSTCTLTGGTLGSAYTPILSASGIVEDVVINANTTFTINCPGVGSKSVTVEVQPKGTET